MKPGLGSQSMALTMRLILVILCVAVLVWYCNPARGTHASLKHANPESEEMQDATPLPTSVVAYGKWDTQAVVFWFYTAGALHAQGSAIDINNVVLSAIEVTENDGKTYVIEGGSLSEAGRKVWLDRFAEAIYEHNEKLGQVPRKRNQGPGTKRVRLCFFVYTPVFLELDCFETSDVSSSSCSLENLLRQDSSQMRRCGE